MKIYVKPCIKSEDLSERISLSCADFSYYIKEQEDTCKDEYLGQGKIDWGCAKALS